MDDSNSGDCNKMFEVNDDIERVRRRLAFIGAAGLRTFKLDSTTTSSATITPAEREEQEKFTLIC